ncbi:glycerophosphodiester phosphodiesterase [Streptomonospora nanhaiensis]|uniref:Glycerophosphoryl diester phosphodiesterase n=1 Tax=Streptomonospora nanhaiensis TaxID=1323731 RepID=A0A853BLM5_9ACTN|nr:glycerophosphodiester phosphodiesterase family protein [Streptomonospora nanhaiensis]MBX9390077.1 glycerophosphodiester phosphodiesterase [Streptomonospora nanhaiensis]NYI95567.1 glycerophosphoryl diester phosphodiesterase [Streptomonospora nanhaiensis]
MFRRFGLAVAAMALALVGSGGAAVAVVAQPTAPSAPARPSTGSADPGRDTRVPAVLDVAHRGASAYAPENTLAAIDTARDLRATTVEIDVQRTRDGELVVIHDTTLTRTTDAEEVFPGRGSYAVADFTLAELRRLDAGSWFGAEFAGERVPTFEEALARLARHRLNLLLEVKSPDLYPGIEADIADTLAEHSSWLKPRPAWKWPRLTIQSFDWESVARSHELLPDVPHGLLGLVPAEDVDDYAWADQINPSHTVIDADYVELVHEAGLEVHTYTVNEPDDMRAAIDAGVDGIISDRPDVARRVIAEETAAVRP